jgi:hypothetical protein
METAAEIIDPWLNGDPCEGCNECQSVCGKLQARIDFVLKSKSNEIERLREAYGLARDAHEDTAKELSKYIRLSGDQIDEIERLREALNKISRVNADIPEIKQQLLWCARTARAALNGDE